MNANTVYTIQHKTVLLIVSVFFLSIHSLVLSSDVVYGDHLSENDALSLLRINSSDLSFPFRNIIFTSWIACTLTHLTCLCYCNHYHGKSKKNHFSTVLFIVALCRHCITSFRYQLCCSKLYRVAQQIGTIVLYALTLTHINRLSKLFSY